MSVASEITRIKTNINNAYKSAESKGAVLPSDKNSNNLAECISSITVGGSGGDVIYVENGTDKEYVKGDKVLINLGMVDSIAQDGHLSESTSNNNYNPGSVFLDNDTGYVLFGKVVSKRLSRVGEEWTEEKLGGTQPSGSGIVCFKDGRVRLTNYNSSPLLLTNNTTVQTTGGVYIGSYNNKHYIANKSENAIYEYNPVTNTIGDNDLIDAAGSFDEGYIDPNTGKGFLISTTNLLDFIKINESGIFSWDGSVTVPVDSATLIETFTGADVGDYLFFGSNYKNAFNTTFSGVVSNFYTYQIVDRGDGARALILRDDLFKEFKAVNAECQFDLRNDILTVGTDGGVFTYKLNRDTNEFEILGTVFELMENEPVAGDRYKLVYSPDLSRALVTLRIGYNLDYRIYNVYSNKTKIVENVSIMYNPINSITGFATGKVDGDGKVEVQTVLPKEVVVTVTTDVNVEEGEIIIQGATV